MSSCVNNLKQGCSFDAGVRNRGHLISENRVLASLHFENVCILASEGFPECVAEQESSYRVGGSRSFSMICNRTNSITTIPSDGYHILVRSRAGSGSRWTKSNE